MKFLKFLKHLAFLKCLHFPILILGWVGIGPVLYSSNHLKTDSICV